MKETEMIGTQSIDETATTMIERFGETGQAQDAAWRTYNRLAQQDRWTLAEKWAAVAHAIARQG